MSLPGRNNLEQTPWPVNPAPPAVIGAEEYGVGDLPLTFYTHLLFRYRWRILTFAFFITALVCLASIVLPKRYQSTATLRIDPSGMRTVGENANSQSNIPVNSLRLITTEAAELKSPAVVLDTIRSLRLYQEKEFLPTHTRAASLTPVQLNEVLRKVTDQIAVDQPLETYLLRVSFSSHHPKLSAQIANQLLRSLIQQDYTTRVQALLGSSRSMRSQIVNLRAKMEQSQKALIDYESTHDVLNPDSSDNIMQSRLSQVNQNLGQAQLKRFILQADFNVVKSGNLDALIASDRGRYLVPLQSRLLQDQRRLSQMAQVYGPNYPLYKQQAQLVKHDQTVLNTQEHHVARQIYSQYETAQSEENLLHLELKVQKQRMDTFNLKAIRYYALKAAADSYTKLYYQLQQRIQDASIAANLHSESLRIISPARPIFKAVFPRPIFAGIVALLLSLLVAIVGVIGYGLMDKSVADPQQVELWFQVPVLISLPQVTVKERAMLTPVGYGPKLLGDQVGNEHAEDARTHINSRSSAFREGILGLHSALMLAREKDFHTLAITSALPSEGKSTVAANLAAAFAGMGNRTVLVDTDMRKPSMHRQFKISNRNGLSSLLRNQLTLDQAIQDIPGVPNLSLLTAGPSPSSPAELLHLGLGDLLEQLRGRYDYVVLDCPPILGFADSLTAANLAEASLLVVHAGETQRPMISAALRSLKTVRAQLLGIILNGVSHEMGSYYSYYKTQYKYYGFDASSRENGMPEEVTHE